MPIKDKDYNKAKALLEVAGSKSAEKSHKKHTGSKGSSDSHGRSLYNEAQQDFGGQPTAVQLEALRKAGNLLGV
ncbi:hypothetical protein [Aquimarina longa]|uniref:hypothetical protein n=1 Tax=Aquimarina longa TaxID=1080221 RepID=UPI0007839DE1|nr:hypothetical protein [Aquimarina longa]